MQRRHFVTALAALATPEEIKGRAGLINPFPEPEPFGDGHSAS